MAITDQTRKRLWAASGNRCARCKCRLIQADDHQAGTIVGDECHIIARHLAGPRGAEVPGVDLDAYENLILLCANDHRIIDSPSNTDTAGALRQLKSDHERWVEQHLDIPVPLAGRPEMIHLTNARNGRELFQLMAGFHALQFDYPEPRGAAETDAIAEFSDEIHDGVELVDEMSGAQRVHYGVHLTSLIQRLGELGLLVWCGERPFLVRQPSGTALRLRTAIVLFRRIHEDADLIAPYLRRVQDALGVSEAIERLELVRQCIDAVSRAAGSDSVSGPRDHIELLLAQLRVALEPFAPSALAECRALAQLTAPEAADPQSLRGASFVAAAVVDGELDALRERVTELRTASS